MSTSFDVSHPRLMRSQLTMLSIRAASICEAPVDIHRGLSSMTVSDAADGKSDEMQLAIERFCWLGEGLRYVADKLKQFEGFLHRVYDMPHEPPSEGGATERTYHEVAKKLANDFYWQTWFWIDRDELESVFPSDDWPTNFNSESLTADTPEVTNRRVAFVQAVQQWTPYNAQRVNVSIEWERDRVYGMIDETPPRDPLTGLMFPLNGDGWKELSQEQRDRFILSDMSPADLRKVFACSWDSLKPRIDAGEIRAVIFTKRRYRIVASDLPN